MAAHTAIADAMESVAQLLIDELGDLVGDQVRQARPSETPSVLPALNLFLYHVSSNPQLRNRERTLRDASYSVPPPLTYDLWLLLTPYASELRDEQELTGRAAQVLADTPVLRGNLLHGGLAGASDEIRILPWSLSAEQLTSLWNGFPDTEFRLSLAYQLSPIQIESTLDIETHPVTTVHRSYSLTDE